jgi:hypothetical protein
VRAALLLALLAPRPALAGAAEGGGTPQIVEETSIVVWDHRTQVEHLLVAARVDLLKGQGLYAHGLPADAVDATGATTEGIVKALASLSADALPLPFVAPGAGGGALRLLPAGAALAASCAEIGLRCGPSTLSFARRHALGVLPISAPDEGGSATTSYQHTRFPAPRPIIPFAEPAAPPERDEPPPPSEEHPPHVSVWVELGNETRSGQWERQIDQVASAQSKLIGECYGKALEKSRRLTGDVHIQMRIAADGAASDEGERASSPLLEAAARCAAGKLAKATWPGNPFKRPVRFEVHAQLMPPRALRRVARALVLCTTDAVPRLGSSDGAHPVPELKEIRSEEPDPEALRRAFDEPLRRELGLDLQQRWRLVVFETALSPHGENDEIEMLALAPLPPLKPGEAPLPIVARGDRPTQATTTPPPRWWQRRRLRLGGLALVVLVAVILLVLWNDRRR